MNKEKFIILIIISILLFIVPNAAVAVSNKTFFIEPIVIDKFNISDEIGVSIIPSKSVDYSVPKTKIEKINLLKEKIKERKSYEDFLLKILSNEEFKLSHRSEFGNEIRGKLSKKGLNKLKSLENLGFNVRIEIPKDGSTLLEESRPLINTEDVWNINIGNKNIKGLGENICVIDSGVNANHPYLSGKVNTQKCFCKRTDLGNGGCCPNKAANDTNASDDFGHGTHVSSIIVSNGSTKGIAPDSKLSVVKITNSSGGYLIGDLRDAITWCTLQENVSIISMSLGTEIGNLFNNSFLCQEPVIDDAYALNITLIGASGNDGVPTHISHPACNSKVISVGATYDKDFLDNKTYLDKSGNFLCKDNQPPVNNITCFSNSGNLLKLLAPGADILAADLTGISIGAGTSSAVPHVSGAVSLLQQYNKLRYNIALSPDQIILALNDTGLPILDARNNLFYQRIDIMSAIDSLTTIKVGDPINDRKIRQSQTWKTKLNVSDSTNKDIFLELSWTPNTDKINLSLLGPDGSIHNGSQLEWSQQIKVARPVQGIWTIKVFGSRITSRDKFVTFDLKTYDQTREDSTPPDASKGEAGGINFTFSRLNYISACNNTGSGLTVVLKSEKANSSQPIVDISNKTNLTSKAFLTGLVLPNHKMIVSMYPFGSVSIDSFLARTEAGRVMLDADVKLKFTFYSSQQSKNEYLDLVNYWNSLLNQGSYVNELKNAGYIGGFSWEARQWISPNSLKAEGESCKVFLTNATLNVDSELRWGHSGIDSYNVRQEVKDYVKDLFTNNFTTNLTNWLNRNAQRAQSAINTEDQYADLRYVYASLAMAQWYKTLDRSQVLFGNLIDGNSIYDYNLNISYDEEYWKQQSKQRLTENLYFNCFTSGTCYTWIFGGVSYINLNTNITSVLSNDTKQVITNAVSSLYAQKSTENNSYYYANFIEVKKADLAPIAIGFSALKPHTEEKVNISIALKNKGNADAKNFTVNFYYNYTNINGTSAIYPIGIVDNQNVSSGGVIVVKKEWSSGQLGKYNIFAEVDYNNNVSERNELNNVIKKSIERINPYPNVTITSPANNVQAIYYQKITFTGTATDLQDGALQGSAFNWSSNIDGYLGSGTTLTTNLSPGAQIVTLTVTDSEGFKGQDTVSLGILASKPPVASLISPVNRIFAEGETIYFEGSGDDKEDGPNLAYTWNSSVDGLLSNYKSFSTRNLSVGSHVMSFGVIDSTSLTNYYTFNLTINEGSPNVIILNPTNNQEISYKAITNFLANATDPQDGNISSSILWTSSINGNIGNGNSFSYNLSIGTHIISTTVTDRHGNIATDKITITVKTPQYPTASIISPRNKQVFTHGDNITFTSTYNDFEDSIIPNSSLIWNSSIVGIFGNGTNFIKLNMSIGNHTISFIVTDSDSMGSTATVNITVNPAPPIPSISTPKYGTIFGQAEYIIFNGTATDYEDGELPGSSLNWTSNKNGFLGIGTVLNLTNLTVGTHLITLTANDSSGLKGTSSLNIIVVGLGQILINKFADGSTLTNLNFTTAENKTAYVKIPKNANVTYAAINIRGLIS